MKTMKKPVKSLRGSKKGSKKEARREIEFDDPEFSNPLSEHVAEPGPDGLVNLGQDSESQPKLAPKPVR
jgi:hypothetical protein